MSTLGVTSGPRTDSVIQWLLDGDPAIRWQALRDLVGAAERTVEHERRKVARDGWGARLLARQDPEGTWAGGRRVQPTLPSTRLSAYSRACDSTSYTADAKPGKCGPRSAGAGSSSWYTGSFALTVPAKSSSLCSLASLFRPDGTTTSCAPSIIFKPSTRLATGG